MKRRFECLHEACQNGDELVRWCPASPDRAGNACALWVETQAHKQERKQ